MSRAIASFLFLALILGCNVSSKSGSPASNDGPFASAKTDRAKLECQSLAMAAEAYILRNDTVPSDIEQLRPLVENTGSDPLLDPWGKPYQLRMQKTKGSDTPIIFTTAPDGTEISNLMK
jgi:hypothetical protein